jgi:hypothetical protein
MPTMPSHVEMEELGGRVVHTRTKSLHEALLGQERAGRLMRDAQVKDNCTLYFEIPAVFEGDAAAQGVFVSDWIEFGSLNYVRKPMFTTGSERQAQEGETPELNAEATNFDPSRHFTMPCAAMVLRYRTDEKGFYRAAKVLCFALGAVPEGYRALVHGVFTGPAIRKG